MQNSRVEEETREMVACRLVAAGVPDLAGQDQLIAHIAATAAHESPQGQGLIHELIGNPPHLGEALQVRREPGVV